MALTWTTEQRRDTAAEIFAGLLANATVTPSLATGETLITESVRLANLLLNSLAGTVLAANETDVTVTVAPTIIKRADDLP